MNCRQCLCLVGALSGEFDLEYESVSLARVRPSATISMAALARTFRAQGRDVISLANGEPDFDTPENIRQAAIRAIQDGKTKYTAVDGIAELKAAVAAKLARDNRLTYGTDEINISPGGKAVIYNALAATLSPSDEVLIPAPYYVSYPDMVRLAGAAPVIVQTAPEHDFKLTPQQLKASITTSTKWLILNSPSNPTGSAYSDDELRALAEVLLRHPKILILSDDIYEYILFDGRQFATIAEVEPELRERTLTVNGVSKAFAMTGWRIGFAAGPKSLIALMAKVMSQTTSNACSIAQWAAVEALTGPQEFPRFALEAYDKRRRLVVGRLRRSKGLVCGLPSGAFYVFADCRGQLRRRSPSGNIIATDEDFALELLETEGVAVVHGAAFGTPGYFRLSFAAAPTLLEEACTRIERFCSMTSAA